MPYTTEIISDLTSVEEVQENASNALGQVLQDVPEVPGKVKRFEIEPMTVNVTYIDEPKD